MKQILRLRKTQIISCILMMGALPQFWNTVASQKVYKIYDMANTPIFSTNIFRTVGVGKEGHLYAGTLRLGFYQFNGLSWQKSTLLTNNSINDIQTDDFGGLWVAQSGYNSGSNQSITGGINYFPDTSLTGYVAYGSADGVLTRNCRGVFIDKAGYYLNNRHRIWGAHLGDVTGGVTKSGGVGLGLNSSSPFFSRRPGTDSTNMLGTVQCIGGNETEVWAFANANYSKNQILRYNAISGSFIGVYDDAGNIPQLFPGFFVRSILFDTDGRQWLGLSSGGLVVKNGSQWATVNMPSIFPVGTIVNNNSIFEDSRGKIYVGTSNGLAIYSGGNIENTSSWKLMTTLDSLPHNNVFDICENTKTGDIIVATTGGIAFLREKMIAELEWDYSYPQAFYPKPKGVAADGVSRLYIKITADTSLPNIKKAELTVMDYLDKPANLKGKVRKVENFNFKYSDQANTGASNYAVDSVLFPVEKMRFWYISPEDYNAGSALAELTDERIETVKIVLTFSNDTKDSTELDIRIVRPPLVMVHGLASGPEAWNNFHNYNGKFISSPVFKHKRALKLSGRASFKENASHLIDPDDENSLQFSINQLREKGYASNQVDYVCHSMGGMMLRAAIEYQNDKFINGPQNYRNYAKGLVHKMITINTPHNSSPVADLIAEYIPQLEGWPKKILGEIYKRFPDTQKPFDFFEPSVGGDLGIDVFPFVATPAVKNLSVRHQFGGINMEATQIRNHLIAGNVGWTSANTARFIAGVDPILELIDELLDRIRDEELNLTEKIFINTLYGLNKAARAWSFLERYSAKSGYPNFLGSSDLVVPLSSQLAKQDPSATHIKTFPNSSGSLYDANHVSILDRLDVGDHVLDLLNAPVNGSLFSSMIPANTDTEPAANIQLWKKAITSQSAEAVNQVTINEQYGSSKIEITSPATGGGLKADSALQVTIHLKDTVGLAYVKLYFQGDDTATISRQQFQTFSFTINPSYTDTQTISALAVYDKPNNIVERHIDTLIQFVTNAAIPDSFRLISDTASITAGEKYCPSLEIHYNNKWVATTYRNSQITAQVQNTSVLSYEADKSFTGIKQGSSKIYFNYLSFKDTLKLGISPALYENSVNRTLSTGSVKNPAIWSKGHIPYDTDSIVIMTGHLLTIDSAIKVRAIKAEAGGSIRVTTGADTLEVGEKTTGNRSIPSFKCFYEQTEKKPLCGYTCILPVCTVYGFCGNNKKQLLPKSLEKTYRVTLLLDYPALWQRVMTTAPLGC
ncbi:MAG: hypothetical protein V4722_08240 [Bacteroidota bacterium]